MKRICFVLLFVAVNMGVYAQHVAPLKISLAEFSLSSLREQYGEDKPMYKSELQRIQLIQDANEVAIEGAKKELKEEKAHAKNMTVCLEQLESTHAALQKQYAAEEKALISLAEMVDKQLRKTRQLALLNTETCQYYVTLLQGKKREIERSLEDLSARQKALETTREKMAAEQSALYVFESEIRNKEIDLNHLIQTHKNSTETIKSELKSVKAAMQNK